MDKNTERIINVYAHDFRQMKMSENELSDMLRSFLEEAKVSPIDKEFAVRKVEAQWIKELDDKLWALITAKKGEDAYTENHTQDILDGKIIAYNVSTKERLQNILGFVVKKLVDMAIPEEEFTDEK